MKNTIATFALIIALLAKIVYRIGGSAILILVILAFCGIVSWMLILTVFLVSAGCSFLSVFAAAAYKELKK